MEDRARREVLSHLYAFPGHLLWRAAARVGAEIDRLLPPGIDLHAYAVLLALADEEPQSQRSLASMVGVSGTTLTSVAQALQRDALVERIRNPEDRRSYSLTRTAAGRSAVHEWAPHAERLEQRLTSTFDPGDAARLRAILVRIIGDQLDERTPAALRASTGFLVTKAHQRAHREFMAALQPLDIEPRHFGTMRALRAAGPATQGQLARLLDVSPATVVQTIDHLEARGLVTRERDPSDRRAYRLHLTPEADRVLERAATIGAELVPQWIGDAHGPDLRDLVRLLPLLLTGTEHP
jgi:DNA-binding MarR family transcriptional regulator